MREVARRIGAWALWDALLPLLAYALLIGIIAGPVLRALDTLAVIPSPNHPDDSNSTLWFYWWVHRAFWDGRPLLEPDMVCAPKWEPLGRLFGNRVDALSAIPFFSTCSFPRSYNLFIVFALLGSAWAGYGFSRALTHNRIVAWALGALVGLNFHTFWEINNGRPNTAILAWYAVFAGAWLMALRAPGIRRGLLWAVAAGLLGALTVHAYVVTAFFMAIFGLGAALFHLLIPAPGVSRARPLLAGLLTATLGGVFSIPYVHETQVLRDPNIRLESSEHGWRQPRWPWDPVLWRELELWRDLPSRRSGGIPHVAIRSAQERAMPLPYLWGEVGPMGAPASPTLTLMVTMGLLLLVGGRRVWPWAIGAGFFFACSLGPYVTEQVGPPTVYIEASGQKLRTPLWWILVYAQPLSEHIRPYRLFTPAWLCSLGLVVVGLSRLEELLQRRLSRWSPLVVGVLAVFILGLTLGESRYNRGLTLVQEPVPIPEFIYQLRDEPGDFVVVELPPGIGEAGAAWQVVHEKRRSEPFHQTLGLTGGGGQGSAGRIPGGCYELAFLRELLRTPPAPSVAAIERAVELDFRYLLLHRRLISLGYPRGTTEASLVNALNGSFGAPIFRDAELYAWRISVPPAPATAPG